MNSVCIIHHWLVDSASGSLIHEITGEQRRLGEYQLKLLQVLIEHAGEILTREELNNLVWERRVIGNNSLPNAIHALRVALEDDGKQQRIIKTIPKKGYILEVEFCQFVTAESSEDIIPGDLPSAADLLIGSAAAQLSAADAPQQAEEEKLPQDERPFWRWLVLGQALLLAVVVVVVGAIIAKQLFPAGNSTLVEKNSTAYSNIRLVEISRCTDTCTASEDLDKQLGPVLFALNQNLKNKHVQLVIFFFTSGNSLNYTMTFKNRCENKQLAMNIINWRTNGAQLRALIYREGERKINEMANCIN